MFGVQNKIVITQVSTAQYPGRTKSFTFNFLTDGTGNSTWSHLTDTFKLVLPRRIYFKDENGKVTTWDKEPIYGNPSKQPLIMRGDKISVELGYTFFKPTQSGTFDRTELVTQVTNRFNGYIVRIKNKTPFEIECEDNMFALKQTLVEDKEWNINGTTYTLETMLAEMMRKSAFTDAHNFTIKTDNYKHNIGNFITQGVTMAQALDELRKKWHFESFFVGNELRCGVIRYYPEDRVTHAFDFQKNISEDDLDYQRADDMRIGIIAKSIEKTELATVNSKGKPKTQQKRLEVTVGDKDGELRTLFFFNDQSAPLTIEKLKELAEAKLPFLKYEGFRGSFTTFGLPDVKHGDLVQLNDNILPERNGTYLVKSVEDLTNSGIGIKQRISLDIRVDGLTTDQLTKFSSNGL